MLAMTPDVRWDGLTLKPQGVRYRLKNLHPDIITTRVEFMVITIRAWTFVLPRWWSCLALTILFTTVVVKTWSTSLFLSL